MSAVWKRLVCLCLLLSVTAAFAACGTDGEEDGGEDGIEIYYKLAQSHQNKGDLIGALRIAVPEGADSLHLAMSALQEQPDEEGYEAPLPANVRFVSYDLDNGALRLNMTGGYIAMNGLDRTIAKACITLTLCSLKEIDSLSIVVDGTTVDSGLTQGSVVLPNMSTNVYERQLTMYFPDSGNTFLVPEAHTLTIGQDKLLAEYAMDELIRGPQSEDGHSAIPAGTEILSVEQRRGVCTVNLSSSFYENRPDTAAGERLTIYSIVNTLTAIEGIEAVQLLVDGAKVNPYVYTSLELPAERSEMLIGPIRTDKNEILVNVYMQVAPGLLTPVPVAVRRDSYDTLEQCAVKYVLSAGGCCGYNSVIPEGSQANLVTVQGDTCLIDLSAEFLAVSRREKMYFAAKAIAATVIDLGTVEYVTITVEGEYYGSMRKLTKDSSIIVE